ncbi:glycosyltransferase family 2 protein [Aeromonas veronii]|nr:glycosyltransferase family 2 protein [Aeromonas veronii]
MTEEVVTSSSQNHFARYSHIGSELIIDGCQPNLLPDLSVMIPTFRRPHLLKEAIESVVNQTAHGINIEIVIVDNDAETNSSELASLVESFFPNNIRLFRNKENIGMFGNWNRCIELARAPKLTILNDDDLLHPEFIKITNNLSEQKAICVACVQFKERNELHWSTRTKIRNRALTCADFFIGNPIPGSLGFVFNKKSALELGGYSEALWPTADYDFSYRYYRQFGINQTTIPLAGYRWQENESMKVATLEGFLANDINFRNNIIREGKYSHIKIKMLCLLIDFMAVSAAIRYKEINTGFCIDKNLLKNKVPMFYATILNCYSFHRVFLKLMLRICKILIN